jgi:hypothetical protein
MTFSATSQSGTAARQPQSRATILSRCTETRLTPPIAALRAVAPSWETGPPKLFRARNARLGSGGLLPWYLVLLVAVLASSPLWSTAHAMGVRDILYLNKYGESVADVSWCSDQAFTFVTHGPSREHSLFPAEYSRVTTVNMFSVETQQVRPVVTSEYAAFGVDCVKGGEYVFLNGAFYTATAVHARDPAQALFFPVHRCASGDWRAARDTRFASEPRRVWIRQSAADSL